MIINVIQLLHLLLVLVIFLSIFIPIVQVKKIAFVLLIYIFLQYITNYGKCGLTELEYMLKGEKYKEGFIYRLVKPIITMPEKYFNQHLYVIHFVWVITLGYQLKTFNFILG